MTTHTDLVIDAEEHATFLCDTFAHFIYVKAYLHGYKHGFVGGENHANAVRDELEDLK